MQVKSVNVIDKYFVFLDIFMSASEELKTGDSLFLQLPHQISIHPSTDTHKLWVCLRILYTVL